MLTKRPTDNDSNSSRLSIMKLQFNRVLCFLPAVLFVVQFWGVVMQGGNGFLSQCNADEIGFIEKFALAADREAVLKELVPGTEDYYYFHCLHYQNTEAFDAVDAMTKKWVAKFGYTNRAREILNRQALLTYEINQQKSIDYLVKHLGIRFNHQRENFTGPSLASVLNKDLISRKTLTARALARYSNTDGFETGALDWLMDSKLEMADLRHLLQRTTLPDHPELVKLIVAELSDRYSRGFGSMTIHRNLTQAQLQELQKLYPKVLNQTNFVNIYLSKIRPSADVDFATNDSARLAHLEKTWEFVKGLAPVHNSLKANVLYHRLAYDRSHGIYDRERFANYLKLPRNSSYTNPDFLRRDEHKRFLCNLGANYQTQTLLPPIGNDVKLTSDFLQHFFQKDQDYKVYEPYLRSTFLKRQFAETKIVNGLGNPEKWASMISPAEYQEIKDRVDLDFTYENKRDFLPADEVAVELNVKNVPKLIVKVFEINTQNFFRDRQVQIDTNIELDGLLPNQEKTYEYKESPYKRRKIQFRFPELKARGVYVVDFIGNRKSCRALVRKGQFRFVEKLTAAGHELTVVNEANQVVKNASVWVQGKQISADEDGKVLVPFSNRPGTVPVVLSDGNCCSLDHLNHRAESYTLDGSIYIDRESLIAGQKADVVIRTLLRINGRPTSIDLLENVRLILTSTNFDGTVSTKEIKDFKVFDHKEATYRFNVPPRLQAIQAQLFASVKNLSKATEQTLSVSGTYFVNKMEKETKVEDLYFSQIEDSFCVDLLGKTGELKVARPINLKIKHRDFKNVVTASLQTDMRGRIKLGKLTDVTYVEATGPEGTKRKWYLPTHRNNYRNVNARAGEKIVVPLSDANQTLSRQDVALMSQVGQPVTFAKDYFDNVKLQNGLLVISDLPAGDYVLRLKRAGVSVPLHVSAGDFVESQILGEHRLTKHQNDAPLQISKVAKDDEKTTIWVSGASEGTRVHVIATRYQPRFDVFDQLGSRASSARPSFLPRTRSLYVDGRKIGDEYQYILDRKYAEKHPGVMLKRPGLLLQPWAVRSTQTSKQNAAAGSKFGSRDQSKTRNPSDSQLNRKASSSLSDESTLDFLPFGSSVLTNLAVKNGKVEFGNDLLRGNQQIHVLAIRDELSAYHCQAFKESTLEPVDRSFVSGLDPESRYARKKEITFVDAEKEFTITDIRTGKFEIYDNLPGVYRLFSSLNADPKLAEFRFILDWRNKEAKEKQELYSRYACHELNFFLFKKDPEFFLAVVQPYLKNKKDKTFLDHYLIGNDLSEYKQAWSYSQLNIVERILLASKLEGEGAATKRHVSDQYDINPTSPSRFEQLFQFALFTSSLDPSDVTLASVKDKISAVRSEIKMIERESLTLSLQQNQSGEMLGQQRGGAVASRNRFGRNSGGTAVEKYRNNNFSIDGNTSKKAKSKSEPMAANGVILADEFMELDALQVDDSKSEETKKYFKRLNEKRKSVEQLFRQVEKTKEWAENNYYHLTMDKQNASLVTVNQFWNDFAEHNPAEPFFSENVAEASGNFTEMMFALSVLDLEWESAEHGSEVDRNKIQLKAKTPMLIYHEQIRPAADGRKGTSILVSQNFFKVGDRYRYEGPDRLDKFVTDEFVKQTPYGCQVVVTNPTSSKQKIDLLIQVPVGTLPLAGSLETKSVHLELEPYRTSSIEYYFYFPEAGKYNHYPVNVAKKEAVIAFAEPIRFNVVNAPSKVDKTSWDYISQSGTNDEVLAYLDNNNLFRTDLNKIAWRMQDDEFFQSVTSLLSNYHVFHPVLWSYGFKHKSTKQMSDFLQFRNDFVNATGAYIQTSLLTNDRVARKTYEHLEYDPLINARSHQLGPKRKILNDRFHAQYHRLLWILACKQELQQRDVLPLTYYMLLQDRITEAKQYFTKASAGTVQYDYMAAYLDMFNDQPKQARQIASKYIDFKVDRWRKAFAAIVVQLDEIDGKPTELVDDKNREQVQSKLAAASPSFDFKVDAKKVELNFANLKTVQVNYYVMDVELLFSRNPFVQNVSGELTYIRPRSSQLVELPEGKSSYAWSLPKELDKSNVLVEITSGGQTKSQAYYAHALTVQMMEGYGQLKVSGQKSGRSIPRTYCKVYAQMRDGSVKFYKDGYTDLRGRFDYTSLSTNDLDNVSRFSILVMSEDHGATVKEAVPPKR